MNAGPRSAEMVRRARRGVLLSEALAESGTGGAWTLTAASDSRSWTP